MSWWVNLRVTTPYLLHRLHIIYAHWDDDMPSRLQGEYNKELLLDDIVVLYSKITTTYRDSS